MTVRRSLLMMHEESVLPSEYKQIEYLESNGTQYIDTGITFSPSGWGFTVDCTITNNTDYGAGSGVPVTGGLHYIYQISIRGIRTGGGDSSQAIRYQLGSRITIQTYYDNENRRTVGIGNEKYQGSAYSAQNGSLCILKCDPNRPLQEGKLYSASVTQNSVLISNLVPCYRKSDNKPGLYDTIRNQFLTNAGTGEFIIPQ